MVPNRLKELATKSPLLEEFAEWMAFERGVLLNDLSELVSVDTTSPNEPRAYEWLREYFQDLGGLVYHLPRHPELFGCPAATDNEYRDLPDEARGGLRVEFSAPDAPANRHTLFSAHVDVVPPGPDFRAAYRPRVDGDRIVGRGTADTKGNIIMLAAALRFARASGRPLRRRVSVDLVPEEEIGGNGALSSVLHGSDATEVVVLEPTELEVFHGHRGCTGFAAEFAGISSHMGGRGVSAIDAAIEYLTLLRALEADLLREARAEPAYHGVDRPMQINVGMIEGGQWPGSVPERCTVRGYFGFTPRYSVDHAMRLLAELLDRLDAPGDGARAAVRAEGIHNGAYLGDPDAPVARELRAAARTAGARAAERRAWNVSCDARLYHDFLRVPTVIFGAGSLVDAHSSREGLSLAEWARGAAALAAFLTEPEELA